jgi:hypothetical protein
MHEQAENRYFMVVIPNPHHRRAKKLYIINRLQLLTAEEMRQLTPSIEPDEFLGFSDDSKPKSKTIN